MPGFTPEAIFSPGLDRWLALFRYGQDLEPGTPEFGRLDGDIKEAADIMEGFTRSQKARYTYEKRMEWLGRMESMKQAGRAEGLVEGKTEGKAEKAREAASNLKRLGVAPTIIAEATGLSLEEVAGLAKGV